MKKVILIISILFISCGLMLLTYNMFLNKTQEKIEEEQLIDFFEKFDNENAGIVSEETEEHFIVNNYLGVIEIPSISLETGIVMSNSNFSTMNKSVSIYPNSNMPNEVNGNFVLFAHTGSSRVSYFKNIHKLVNGDEVYIYYNNVKYTYKVINKYNVSMYDYTPLNKMKGKTIITLMTCKKGDNKYRTIIVGELVND